MKKYTFLLAFLAGLAFSTQSLAAPSIDDDSGYTPPTSDPKPSIDDNTSTSSGSEVTKSRPFTPAEAASATKDNGKNSVTINF